MPGVTGHGILSRVRSQRKLRTVIAAEELETPKLSHRRQRSDSAATATTTTRSPSAASRSDFPGAHWPPIEFDPLKLNPPVQRMDTQHHAPARLHERQPLQCLRTKRSFASAENRRPPRLHHSDSGFALFDFAQATDKDALPILDRNRQREVDIKGWPSPAGSVDSDKSWFDDDDDEEVHEDGEAAAPLPRRRPPIGSPDDPANFIKRGEWKRRGIFFGAQAQEVHTKDDDAFEV